MKMILIAISMFLTASAIAEVPTVTAREVTCQELKEMVANYKTVNVRYPFLRWIRTAEVNAEVTCSPFEDKFANVFKTKDVRRCAVGETCMRRIDHTDRFPRCFPRQVCI